MNSLAQVETAALPTQNAPVLRETKESELVAITAELQRVAEEAARANRAKSEFLANMSHEVRTPMMAILGYTDMLLEPHLADGQRAQALHAIKRNGEHLLQIINDILDLSKIEARKLDYELTRFSPWQVVVDVESTLGVQAHDKGLNLVAFPSGSLPSWIESDQCRVRQILMNLVSNAVKFTQRGNVYIRLKLQQDPKSDDTWLLFEVEDQGMGMTSEQLSRLGEAFFQGDSSTTRQFGGTGLGLRVSKLLANALGGDILVKSEFGKGSTFTLVLPIQRPADEDLIAGYELSHQSMFLRRSSSPPIVPQFRGRVLVAEDSRDNQRILSYLLEQAGLTVTIAPNGRIAVDKVAETSFDLILMDMQMPELDGYGATSLLRQQGYTQPIIALTANAMRGDQEKCLQAGCSDYLAKPIDRDKFFSYLTRYLPASCRRASLTIELAPKAQRSSTAIHSACEGDDVFMELVVEYVNVLPNHLKEMLTALNKQDYKRIAAVAHQLRGGAGMYGYPALGELAGLIEDAIKEGQDMSLVQEMLEEFADLIARIKLGL